MMPVDASIYGQIQQPRAPNRLADLAQVMQIQGMQQQGQLGQLKMDEYRAGQERTNRLNQLLAQEYETPEARETAVLRGGFVDESGKLAKNRLEGMKAQTDADTARETAASKKLDRQLKRLSLYRDAALGTADVAGAASLVDAMLTDPDLKDTPIARIPAQQWLPKGDDPASFDQWRKEFALGATNFIKENKPTVTTESFGGTKRMLERPGLGGAPQVIYEAPMTMTPDAVATDTRMREEGAANRELQRRGQNLTDQRARELNAATLSKPFEVTGEDGKPVLVQQDKQGNIRPVQGYLPRQGASKPLTEGQAKAALFGSRMQAAEAIFETLADKGVTTSIPGSRAGFGVGEVVNAIQPEERQQLDQAKRDFINAVLRRESGAVISMEEFANAEKQYFPQPGEGSKQKAQKKANRELATRGILAEVPDGEKYVAKIRGGAAPSAPNLDALLNKYK